MIVKNSTLKNIVNSKQTAKLPILYSFRRCPYAMRARLAIYCSGINVELREIILRDKPKHMLEISPKGTVPVLLLSNGDVIDESLDIMLWALNQSDPKSLLSNQYENLIKLNDTDFKYNLDRYKYPGRYPEEDCSNAFERAVEILTFLNNEIEKNGYLISDKQTLADIAIFPFVRQFAHVDKERFSALPLPHLQKWLDAHLNSELFKAIMPKFPLWKEGDEPIHFGSYNPA